MPSASGIMTPSAQTNAHYLSTLQTLTLPPRMVTTVCIADLLGMPLSASRVHPSICIPITGGTCPVSRGSRETLKIRSEIGLGQFGNIFTAL